MSITITKSFKPNGVLTDPTGNSMKLSDPTGTFGVKRTDTDAVVVADDVSMTRLSTGIYTYTFDEPADSLTYEYWTEFVYAGETHRLEFSIVGGVSQSNNLYDLLPRIQTMVTGIINLVELKQKLRRVTMDFFRRTEIWVQDLDVITSVADQEDYSLTTSYSAFIHRVKEIVITNTNDNKIPWRFKDVTVDGGTVTIVPAYTTAGDDIDVKVVLIPEEDCTQFPTHLLQRWGQGIVDGTIGYYAGRAATVSYDPVKAGYHLREFEDAISSAKGENFTLRGPGLVVAIAREFV